MSVVITYYNEPEEFLLECLQSVLAQTFSQWEVIVSMMALTSQAHM